MRIVDRILGERIVPVVIDSVAPVLLPDVHVFDLTAIDLMIDHSVPHADPALSPANGIDNAIVRLPFPCTLFCAQIIPQDKSVDAHLELAALLREYGFDEKTGNYVSTASNGKQFVMEKGALNSDAQRQAGACRTIIHGPLFAFSQPMGPDVWHIGAVSMRVDSEYRPMRIANDGAWTDYALLLGNAREDMKWNDERTLNFHMSVLKAAIVEDVCMGLTLLQCKNVSARETCSTTKPPRRYEEQHGKHPPRYYVLDIEPMRQKFRDANGGNDGISLAKALHICRGHFKDYREKPLFGKVSGMFWWQPHVRGTAEAGIVEKEYRIKLP